MSSNSLTDKNISEDINLRNEIVGNYFKMLKGKIPRDYQVLIGFSGYGNVGFLSVNHLVEQLELETIGMWGKTIWYYIGRLESIVTLYAHHESKTLLLVSRYPFHVTHVPHEEWEEMTLEVLSWGCKAYYIIAGLREETRSATSTDWVAYAPTPAFTKSHGIAPSMEEKLTMIGPLATFLSIGTSLNLKVLGLLIYCNFDEDPESALIGLREIEKFTNIKIPNKDRLVTFDWEFLRGLISFSGNRRIQDIIETISDMDPDDLDIISDHLMGEDDDEDDDDEEFFDYREFK